MLRFAALLFLGANAIAAQTFERAQQDVYHRIAGLTTTGTLVLIAPAGRYAAVQLSDDHKTVLWRATSQLRVGDRLETVSYRIGWYRGGDRHSFSANGAFVRDTWLVDSGRRIGVSYGGLHFAGLNVLLEARTGRKLASFADEDKTRKPVPAWVR